MTTDFGATFVANPAAFINNNAISLIHVSSKMPKQGGIPKVMNLQKKFTLSRETKHMGLSWSDDLPTLRMMPGLGGNGLHTFDSWYLHASDGGDPLDSIPYCDIPIAPGGGSPNFLFTVGMNGCALIIASAVPGTAPPLAMGHWRVLHDHSHYSLAQWNAGGYTVRFASYCDPAEAGPVPGAFAAHLNQVTYNPNNYPWHYLVNGQQGATVRVVTNFLYWNGVAWTFNSRHFHNYAATVMDVDTPPGTLPAVSSTQSVVI